jgi:hypothetical protein
MIAGFGGFSMRVAHMPKASSITNSANAAYIMKDNLVGNLEGMARLSIMEENGNMLDKLRMEKLMGKARLLIGNKLFSFRVNGKVLNLT